MPIAAQVRACAQLSVEVVDALVSSAVSAGRAGEVLGTAAVAVTDDPLREPAVLLLMRVLAAAGQASEALRVARDHRHRLAEETGLDSSAALGELEREIAGGGVGLHRSTGTRRPDRPPG